jgi:hypothetical protein
MLITSFALALAIAPHGKMPAGFDNLIAGYAFAYDEKHNQACTYDSKSGYCIMRSIECDGADLTLLLTHDRYLIEGMGYDVPNFGKVDSSPSMKLIVKPLPSLSTGKGVRIGYTPAQLRFKLGRPTKIEKSGSRHQFTDYVYHYIDGTKDDGDDFTQTYTFKAGKLIEIRFSRSPLFSDG